MLTPEQRKKLVEQPLGTLGIHTHSTSYPWGGTIVNDNFQHPDDQDLYILRDGKRYVIGKTFRFGGFQITSGLGTGLDNRQHFED